MRISYIVKLLKPLEGFNIYFMEKKKIGFIGQGYIGKNYADDFEERGFPVVRYALEEPYNGNGKGIKDCEIVFIAVPTPTKPDGFDPSIVKKVIKLIGKGNTAVIKSTLLPGTTEEIQKENPEIFVMHSPEFLTEANAQKDAQNPERNIIGIPEENEEYQKKGREVLEVLPQSPFELICSAREAELIKYGGNCFLYTKVVFMNLFYDLVRENRGDWETVKKALSADKRIGASHMDPVHESGRGAGGNCFIKDFAAFREAYEQIVGDEPGVEAIRSLEKKNCDLLKKSKKSLDLLKGVYGED